MMIHGDDYVVFLRVSLCPVSFPIKQSRKKKKVKMIGNHLFTILFSLPVTVEKLLLFKERLRVPVYESLYPGPLLYDKKKISGNYNSGSI